MEIFKRPPTAKGPAATFTGDVWVDGIYAGPGRFMAHLVLMEGDDSDAPQTIWGGKVAGADYEAPRTSTC
jgi:hypothetical protein